MLSGMGPWSSLLARPKPDSSVSFPMCAGIVPDNMFNRFCDGLRDFPV
jgi:hypothetical protein